MADIEVENTLREIRERVLATTPARATAQAPATVATHNGGGSNSAQGADAVDALARMDANLSTTARAWSRLPPVMTYRRGALARFELWLKGLIKRAAHWFTWEQVNFNSAAHHALGDALAALSAHEQGLARAHADAASLRQALEAQQQAHGRALEQSLQQVLQPLQQSQQSLHSLQQAQQSLQQWQQSLQQAQQSLEHSLRRHIAESDERTEALSSALAAAESRLAAELTTLARAFEEGVEQLRAEMGAHAEGLRGEQRAQLEARVGELHEELRERAEGVLEEQRVCFRQLSLEAGEEAVMHDRARRQIEARIEALEKAINRES